MFVVTPVGIFNVFSTFFFLCYYTLSTLVQTKAVPVHICRERDEVLDSPSRDCDVSAPRVDVVQLCCRSQPSPRQPLHRSKIRVHPISAIYRHFSLLEILVCLFLCLHFRLPMPIFVLAFITAQTAAAAALSPRVEFLAIIRFRAF